MRVITGELPAASVPRCAGHAQPGEGSAGSYRLELRAKQLCEAFLIVVATTGWVPRVPRPGGKIGSHPGGEDRKSTRLNSSHSQISYAVFCLKKKKKKKNRLGNIKKMY